MELFIKSEDKLNFLKSKNVRITAKNNQLNNLYGFFVV